MEEFAGLREELVIFRTVEADGTVGIPPER